MKLIEVQSLKDGFKLNDSFVLRKLNLPCNINRCINRAVDFKELLFGYNKESKEIEIGAEEAFLSYKENTLQLNIVDAPFPVLDENELPVILLEAVRRSGMNVCLTLTRKGSYTPLHTDPNFGGGWMYLQEGSKKWQLIKTGHALPDKDGKLEDININTEYISEVVINAGDFLYFAPDIPHRVWTIKNSFGISGYLKT